MCVIYGQNKVLIEFCLTGIDSGTYTAFTQDPFGEDLFAEGFCISSGKIA
jgi:hypothetical protein